MNLAVFKSWSHFWVMAQCGHGSVPPTCDLALQLTLYVLARDMHFALNTDSKPLQNNSNATYTYTISSPRNRFHINMEELWKPDTFCSLHISTDILQYRVYSLLIYPDHHQDPLHPNHLQHPADRILCLPSHYSPLQKQGNLKEIQFKQQNSKPNCIIQQSSM